MKSLSTLIFASAIFAVPVQKANVQTQVPAAGEVLPGANVATATVFSQTGDASSQITAQKGQNALTAVRNFLGDVQMVSNAINLIGSGEITDPATIATLAQVAFNAEINENEQRQIMVAAAGQAGAEANSNILTFTPTVLNGLQAIASNPNQNAQQIALMMGTVRDARILPSISNLATAALGNLPVNTIIQATIKEATSSQGNPQNSNSAFLLGTQGNGNNQNNQGNQKSNSNNNQAGNNSSGDQSSNNGAINDGVNPGGDSPNGNQASRIVGISSSTQENVNVNGNGNENAAQGVSIAKNSNGKQNSKSNSSANKSADAQSNTKGIGNKSNSNSNTKGRASNSASRKSTPLVANSTGHSAGQNVAKGKKIRAPSPNL
ncbi:hypothetical protein HDV04_001840 [Boothiomyces sp. JEL0838]|nr:hypothetical protein HDV04_001840 [Boothiomyces sp. JEL0838]